ncbi:hypothetical protein CMV_007738 [Castanea mollissima]|uniref:TF-B3 domain-containing protein n=1 Tax=Castanea mollissima TaxID=60419 RepID=A0A8J4RT09_9ROSI|nr:hypothetical protein CMV_007738 [Castanea mollissima]
MCSRKNVKQDRLISDENSIYFILQSIPQAFIKYFNGTIPKRAILKDQTGKSWRVGLEQTNRRLCFNSGWHCFASDHSLEFGDFLIFKFNRSSLFEVKIFSKTGCKKEQAAPIGKPIPFVNLEEDSKTELTCSRPTRFGKRKRSEVGLKKIEAGGSSEASRHKLKRTTGTNLTKTPHFDRMRQIGVTVDTIWLKAKVPKEMQNLTANGGSRALETASAFKSGNPFFMVIMQPSYVFGRCNLHIPHTFAKKYLEEKCLDVFLRVPEGIAWPVKYIFRTVGTHLIAELTSGWRAFSRDNKLEVCDVCIFEFIKGIDVSFIVNIFRVAEDANCCLSPGKPKQLIREDCTSSRASLALEAARKFISENPFIKVLITSARLKCAHMDVPSGFIKKYKRGTTRTVMLQVANRSWPVKLLVYPRASYKLSAGWSAFMKENTLKEGDVCIFELIKRDDIVFKVNIFRGIN